jgi:transcriptional regulator with XRE-family HTH domain
MTRKDIAKTIGAKLLKIRQDNNKSVARMARALNCDRVSYARNENGQTIPNFFTIYNLGSQFGISMNWLILDEGPILLKEIAVENKVAASTPLLANFAELIEHMEKIPLLQHEILAQFHRFKEEHPAMVEKAMKTNLVE